MPVATTEPSGPKADDPATAVNSPTPENAKGAIDPAAPGNTGTTPGSVGQKADS